MARAAARHVETLLNETSENAGDKTGTTARGDGQQVA
jgi:hypothetical protein